MSNYYSTSLNLVLQNAGENSTTWGTYLNQNFQYFLEQAIVGQSTIVMANADYVLNNAQGTIGANEARSSTLIITGNQNASYSVITPGVQKIYVVTNSLNSGATAYIKVSGYSAYSIPNGQTVLVYCNGTTFTGLSYTNNALTATNLAGGSANTIPIQSGANTTAFLSPGTSGYILTSGGSGSAPTWSNNFSGNSATATTATNLANGSAGQLVYQTGSGTTSFVTNGTSGQILVSAGSSVPAWTNASSITAGSVTNSLTINSGGTGSASGTTFNGSSAVTISYNSIGASPLAGSSSLTTVGTITSGTWQGSAIQPSYVATLNQNTTGTAGGLSGTPNITVGTIASGTQTVTGYTGSNTLSALTSGVSVTTNLAIYGSTTVTLSGIGLYSNYSYTAITNTGNTLGINSSGATLTNGAFSAPTLTSTIATGTAPFTVTSTTPVANLSIGGSSAKIAGGSSNQILYQTSASTTGFITAPSTSGTALGWNGSAFTWITPVVTYASGCVYENGQTITSNYTMTAGNNGMSAGPITVATGITVTIPDNSRWVIN